MSRAIDADGGVDEARPGRWLGLWRAPGSAGGTGSWRSLDGSLVYRYGTPDDDTPRDAGAVLTLLEPVLEVAGASAARVARWHYVVETDVEPSAQADFDAWYTQEHMPGLAAVPGVVRARRFRAWTPAAGGGHAAPAPNAGGGMDGGADGLGAASPRWIATYDLAEREAFNSPPWLAVRATPWSSRVRPSFRNTRRTMFARID
ncbi:MAG: hypothetical protein AB7P21_10905 [Lautropia sp.]